MFNINKYLFLMAMAVIYHECNSRRFDITAPFQFSFKISQTLDMNIQLKNMVASHEYTSYRIYYSSAMVFNDSITTYETKKHIKFTRSLNAENVTVYIELWRDKKLCSNIPICTGHRQESSGSPHACTIKTCDVVVDMKNIISQCDDYNITCTIERDVYYICKSMGTEFLSHSKHQWIHKDNSGTFIGLTPRVNRAPSILNITLEDFDRNTFIQQTILRTDAETKKSNIIKIPDFDGDSLQFSEVENLQYSETNLPDIDCEHYKAISRNIQLAIIDTTYRIQTTNLTAVRMFSGMEILNGSILCCIYYTEEEVGGTKQVTRHVKNKKMLIYEEVNNPNYTMFYITIGVVIAIVIIAIILLITVKVLKKKTTGVQQIELETYACPSNVLYAELNVNSTNQRTVKPHDSDYAVIVGLLNSRADKRL